MPVAYKPQACRYLVKHKYRALLSASLLLIIGYPHFSGPFAEILLDVITSAVLLCALFCATEASKYRLIGIALFTLAIIGTWWPHGGVMSPTHIAGHLFTVAFFSLVLGSLYADVFSKAHIGPECVFGAICIYLLIGLNWSMIYVLIESIAPGSFNLHDASSLSYGELTARFIYFSFTTLTTTGYGDITPTTDIARSIVMLEYGVGVFYLAIMMARLVSAYQPLNHTDTQED